MITIYGGLLPLQKRQCIPQCGTGKAQSMIQFAIRFLQAKHRLTQIRSGCRITNHFRTQFQ